MKGGGGLGGGLYLHLSVHSGGGSGRLWGMFVCIRSEFLTDKKEGKIKTKDEAYKKEQGKREREREREREMLVS